MSATACGVTHPGTLERCVLLPDHDGPHKSHDGQTYLLDSEFGRYFE